MKDLRQELEQRWFLYQHSSDDLFSLFNKWWASFYCWFDPTADSLHLWNFIGFMMWVHLMRRGNKYIALVWWATWMIWDPGWKDAERSFLSPENLKSNEKAIFSQIWWILQNLTSFTWERFEYEQVNNLDFFKNMSYLDFLRDVWKYITVNNMISKDTVKKRVEDPSKSISYTEFSYMLLQWYDFYKLYADSWVKLQVWGQDQWGNLMTGVELIRKKVEGWEWYAMTWPLLVDSSGKKFGKSEWNAIWLDKDKTSPYQIYQYFMNTSDEDVERFLKMLTLIEVEEIEKIVSEHMKTPENRLGQMELAFRVVEIIHWTGEANTAKKISELMFWDSDKAEIIKWLNADELKAFKNELWFVEYDEQNLFETIVSSWLAKSNSEARNAVKSGSIYINEQKVMDFSYDPKAWFWKLKIMLIRKWKKNFKLIVKK